MVEGPYEASPGSPSPDIQALLASTQASCGNCKPGPAPGVVPLPPKETASGAGDGGPDADREQTSRGARPLPFSQGAPPAGSARAAREPSSGVSGACSVPTESSGSRLAGHAQCAHLGPQGSQLVPSPPLAELGSAMHAQAQCRGRPGAFVHSGSLAVLCACVDPRRGSPFSCGAGTLERRIARKGTASGVSTRCCESGCGILTRFGGQERLPRASANLGIHAG